MANLNKFKKNITKASFFKLPNYFYFPVDLLSTFFLRKS